ncbi:uncharacterized protein LOC132545527 [Ylistrum balloti]|uniref:uncharacterized protein LOC132545527 n=1 Tax=Ylistrum balloti TaxID=509963 RepID=UPI002905E24E|nr:uncharacterized protein LOC132545527 [Ylistrum balloti]
MVNYPDSHQSRDVLSLKNVKRAQDRGYLGKAEGPGLLTTNLLATLPQRNVQKLTSANTPDTVERLLGNTAPYQNRFDLQFGARRPPNVKDDNFPPGYNGIMNEEGRRRSAEMAIKLNLHTREFPRKPMTVDGDKIQQQELTDAQDGKKDRHKVSRQKKKKSKADVDTENAEISFFLEEREIMTPGLYAKGKPAPALYRTRTHHEKKPEVVKVVQDVNAKKISKEPSIPGKSATRDAGVNQLMAEIDKKNEEYESYRRNDFFFNRFKGDAVDVKLSDEELNEDQRKDVLPPINGNAVKLGKRKAKKYKSLPSQAKWNDIEDKSILKKGHAVKLPPIDTAQIENSSKAGAVPLRDHTMVMTALTNENDYWRNVDAGRPRAGNICEVGQALRQYSQPELTLPPVFNVKLPPITGLPVQRVNDTKKRKEKRFA